MANRGERAYLVDFEGLGGREVGALYSHVLRRLSADFQDPEDVVVTRSRAITPSRHVVWTPPNISANDLMAAVNAELEDVDLAFARAGPGRGFGLFHVAAVTPIDEDTINMILPQGDEAAVLAHLDVNGPGPQAINRSVLIQNQLFNIPPPMVNPYRIFFIVPPSSTAPHSDERIDRIYEELSVAINSTVIGDERDTVTHIRLFATLPGDINMIIASTPVTPQRLPVTARGLRGIMGEALNNIANDTQTSSSDYMDLAFDINQDLITHPGVQLYTTSHENS